MFEVAFMQSRPQIGFVFGEKESVVLGQFDTVEAASDYLHTHASQVLGLKTQVERLGEPHVYMATDTDYSGAFELPRATVLGRYVIRRAGGVLPLGIDVVDLAMQFAEQAIADNNLVLAGEISAVVNDTEYSAWNVLEIKAQATATAIDIDIEDAS